MLVARELAPSDGVVLIKEVSFANGSGPRSGGTLEPTAPLACKRLPSVHRLALPCQDVLRTHRHTALCFLADLVYVKRSYARRKRSNYLHSFLSNTEQERHYYPTVSQVIKPSFLFPVLF